MNKKEIKVGKTYYNKGKGTTHRKVLDIGLNIKPTFFSIYSPPNEKGVLFEQDGVRDSLYLSSFARWAGGEVVHES